MVLSSDGINPNYYLEEFEINPLNTSLEKLISLGKRFKNKIFVQII